MTSAAHWYSYTQRQILGYRQTISETSGCGFPLLISLLLIDMGIYIPEGNHSDLKGQTAKVLNCQRLQLQAVKRQNYPDLGAIT